MKFAVFTASLPEWTPEEAVTELEWPPAREDLLATVRAALPRG